MRKIILSSVSALLLCSAPLLGQWVLVDDFEGGNLDAWEFFTNQPDTSHTWEIAQDPFDATNNTMVVSTGINPDKRIIPQITLPVAAADGETITFYYRFVSYGPNRNTNQGLTDIAAEEQLDFWSDFEVQHYFNDVGIGGRNGSQFEDGYGNYSDNTWYEVWIVADNGTGVESDLYDLYVRGGAEYAEQTLVAENKNFRNGTTDPLNRFAVLAYYGAASGPDGADPVGFDDIYVAAGEVLSTPPGDSFGMWGPYPISNAEGDVNTGDFMGWLNVTLDPYLYSYTLDAWIYMEASGVSETGGWAYVYR